LKLTEIDGALKSFPILLISKLLFESKEKPKIKINICKTIEKIKNFIIPPKNK